MKKVAITLLLLLTYLFSATGQRSESEIALREYFTDAEFFLAQEYYLDALNDYLQVYKRGYEDNANINYRIGICYLNIPGQKDKAIDYFEKAKKSVSTNYKESSLNEKNAPIDVYLYMGNAYRVNNMLDKAIESYREYKELLPEEELNQHKYADQQIEACNIASEFFSKPVDLEYINLGEYINTSNDDYKAVISGDGSTLVYMHRLPFYDAVYFSKKENGSWTKPQNITPQIMSDGDQFATSLSYDGKTLLLTKEDEFNSDILISRYEDNRWSVSEPLGQQVNTKYWESHACLSKDGKTLYFTSNRRGGAGEMDLYRASLNAEGVFDRVENISELNTELNEDTPFLTEDGDLLFFSSQGFTNMGGYDIFVSKKSGTGWGLPQNLGYPVNSTDDDLFYYPMNGGRSALISKILDDGFGGMDVYSVDFRELPAALIEEVPEKAIAGEPEITQIGEPEAEEATTEEEKPEEEKKVQTEQLTAQVDTTQETPKAEAEEEIRDILRIEIKPVLFGFDESMLTTEGKMELDKVAKLMNIFPGIEVVLSGFTDPLGPESYNIALSKKRAQSALEYLKSKGVSGERLKAVGKGETEFIAINRNPDGSDNPEGRRYNRRVEFEIRGVDSDQVIIKRIDPVPPNLKLD